MKLHELRELLGKYASQGSWDRHSNDEIEEIYTTNDTHDENCTEVVVDAAAFYFFFPQNTIAVHNETART